MNTLIAIAYENQATAGKALKDMKRLQEDGSLDLDQAIGAVKDENGRVDVTGGTHHGARGATGGLLLGTILGALLTVPVFGAIFGAAAGGLSGSFGDVNEMDQFMTELGENMPPGSSILLMTIKSGDADKVTDALDEFGGEVIRTTLPSDAEQKLAAALLGTSQ